MAVAADRPIDSSTIHTDGLPDTPQRERTIPATAWAEAPAELVALGGDIGHSLVAYKRRVGRWLLWRAGPASRGDARYMALDAHDVSKRWTFRVFPDGSGEGTGPDGTMHQRLRTWKESLRDSRP